LKAAGFSGADAEAALHAAGITVNRNAVPNDPRPPAVTSGIRIGTPAVTTRGFGPTEMRLLAGWIDEAIQKRSEPASLTKIKNQVEALCAAFPLYLGRTA
jgi:glycine hydroxymethyltransferase